MRGGSNSVVMSQAVRHYRPPLGPRCRPASRLDTTPWRMEATVGTLLVILLSCGPPQEDSDCHIRCDDCEPTCVPDRGLWAPAQAQECDEECDVDIDSLFCVVEADECVLASG